MSDIITRRGALGRLTGVGAGIVLATTLPATVSAAPVRPAPTHRELVIEAAEFVEREIGEMIAIHDRAAGMSSAAWVSMWADFFEDVGEAKADAIAEHGPAAEAAWDEVLDGMLGAMRAELGTTLDTP